MAAAELRVSQKLNDYEYGVEIWLMRSGLNRNNWNYQNLDKYYLTFAGRPILCAFPRGRVGDGHNMLEKRDANGEMYYSFIGRDGLEKIVGMLSEDPSDFRFEEKNGETWLVAKGKLFTFYAKELVDHIIHSGVMPVSVETEVTESYIDPDDSNIEVFTEWTGLGVTVLNETVAPAIPGASIKALQELASEFKSLKLKAASYINAASEQGDEPDDDLEDDRNDDPEDDSDDEADEQESEDENDPEAADPNDEEEDGESSGIRPEDGEVTIEPQTTNNSKGVNTLNVLHKREVAEIAANFADKFNGYTVLSGGQDEDGIHLCLMAADGSTALYSMKSLDDVIDARKIQKVNTCVSYKVGEEQIDVDTCEFTDSISAKLVKANNELESLNAELATSKATIDAMKAAERTRRISAAKAAAKATLEKFNENRDEKVGEDVLASVNEDIDNGEYAECVNADGEWCGEEKVATEVLAKCAEQVMQYDKAQVARNSSHYIWGEERKSRVNADGVESLLMSWRAKKI